MPYSASQARTSLRDARTSLPPVKRASSVTSRGTPGKARRPRLLIAGELGLHQDQAVQRRLLADRTCYGTLCPGEPLGARPALERSGYPSSFSSLTEAQDAGQPPP